MASALVGSAVHQYPYSTGVSISATNGNLLVIWTSGAVASTTATCSVTNATTPVLINTEGGSPGGSPAVVRAWYCFATSTATCAVTLGSAPSDGSVTVAQYSGIDSVSPIHNSIGTISGATAAAPVSSTLATTVTSTIVALLSDEGASHGSTPHGTGYVDLQADTSHYDASEYALDQTAGNYTPAFTGSTNTWVMLAIALTTATGGGGGGTTSSPLLMLLGCGS